MSVFITKAKSICCADTFVNGALKGLHDGPMSNHAIHPNYREILKVPGLRRMSNIIRMALACGLEVANEDLDAIIVGSGLGNLDHTVKFIDQIEKNENGGPISPTQFIQSTHNTIGGQLALAMKCYNYNMTHVQGGISFETALKDALWNMRVNGFTNVVVGAADEYHPLMETFGNEVGLSMEQVGEGTSFLHLSSEKVSDEYASIDQCEIIHNQDHLDSFIESNEIVLYINSGIDQERLITGENVFDITDQTKVYWSNSALALHLGFEILNQPEAAVAYGFPECKKLTVVNNFRDRFFGVTKISK